MLKIAGIKGRVGRSLTAAAALALSLTLPSSVLGITNGYGPATTQWQQANSQAVSTQQINTRLLRRRQRAKAPVTAPAPQVVSTPQINTLLLRRRQQAKAPVTAPATTPVTAPVTAPATAP